MAKKYKFEWNPQGYDALKKGTEIQSHVLSIANKVLSSAGTGFNIGKRTYQHWDGYAIFPGDEETKNRNYDENILETVWRSLR